MDPVLEGVVQLDRNEDPPRVMLDTVPVQRLDVTWRDILGCWRVRVTIDPITRRCSVVIDMLVIAHRGPFFRLPGQDAFWPGAEDGGLGVESLAAVGQRTQRQASHQLKLQLATPSSALGNLGTRHRVPRPHRKGKRR